MSTLLINALMEHNNVISNLDEKFVAEYETISDVICNAIKNEKMLAFCGNGGSAADAEHIAAEFVGQYNKDRGYPYKAMAFSTTGPIVTAIANDFGYPQVFSRQVRAYLTHGDVLIGLSTSGKSTNVSNAMFVARALGVKTISITGNGQDTLVSEASDYCLQIPSDNTPRIQEVTTLLLHTIIADAEQKVFTHV